MTKDYPKKEDEYKDRLKIRTEQSATTPGDADFTSNRSARKAARQDQGVITRAQIELSDALKNLSQQQQVHYAANPLVTLDQSDRALTWAGIGTGVTGFVAGAVVSPLGLSLFAAGAAMVRLSHKNTVKRDYLGQQESDMVLDYKDLHLSLPITPENMKVIADGFKKGAAYINGLTGQDRPLNTEEVAKHLNEEVIDYVRTHAKGVKAVPLNAAPQPAPGHKPGGDRTVN